MGRALGTTIVVVAATIWGLPTWQLALLAFAGLLLLVGVATLIFVMRIHRQLEGITRDQEVRTDALGRNRSERLKGD